MWRPGDIPFELMGMVFRAVQRREERRIERDAQTIRIIASGRWMEEVPK